MNPKPTAWFDRSGSPSQSTDELARRGLPRKGDQAATSGARPQTWTTVKQVKTVSGLARCARQAATVAPNASSAIRPRSTTRARSDSTVAGR